MTCSMTASDSSSQSSASRSMSTRICMWPTRTPRPSALCNACLAPPVASFSVSVSVSSFATTESIPDCSASVLMRAASRSRSTFRGTGPNRSHNSSRRSSISFEECILASLWYTISRCARSSMKLSGIRASRPRSTRTVENSTGSLRVGSAPDLRSRTVSASNFE